MAPVPNPGIRPASALPSVRARALAFAAILVAGAAGAAIGASVTTVECHGSCSTPTGIGAVVGGAAGAGGTAVVATLTLRAMGEWKTISEEQLYGDGEEADGDRERADGDREEADGHDTDADGHDTDTDSETDDNNNDDDNRADDAQDGVSNRNPSA
jgi:hypothetical protein